MSEDVFLIPASFAQQRLWFLDQMVPGNAFYNLSASVRLSFPVNSSVLKSCLKEIVKRHEILRTTFRAVDGQPYQLIASSCEIDLPVRDFGHLSQNLREAAVQKATGAEARMPYNLEQGPLVRAALFRLEHNDFVFIISMHHIISDAWSRYVFFNELSSLYESFSQGRPPSLPELPLQYADFAVWQRGYLSGEVLENHLSYWKEKLKGIKALRLPLDKKRPVSQSFKGNAELVMLSEPLSKELKQFSHEMNVTLFMTLMSAFIALLYRYSQQDDIVIGVPTANRNHTELEHLIGFFVNSILIRTDLSGDPSFSELLRQVKSVSLEAYTHEDLPFEKLVEELHPERDPGRNPLFQVTFQFLQFPPLSGRQVENSGSPLQGIDKGTAIFDLRFSFTETEGLINGEIEYSSDLFDVPTIKRMSGHFQELLSSVVAEPGKAISSIDFLLPTEKEQLLYDWNTTQKHWDAATPLHGLFEQQAAMHPNRTAIIFQERTFTFAEVNRRANQLAHYLRDKQIGAGSFVGVCLVRSEDIIIAFLGILKAGAAYIPLDPSYPHDRIQTIIDDSNMRVLIGMPDMKEQFRVDAPVICLCELRDILSSEAGVDPGIMIHAQSIAYAIYTSGSTGKPKGVMVAHAAIVNHMLWMNDRFPLSAGDVVMQRTPYSFDASVWECYASLIAGTPVFIAEDKGNIDPEYIVKAIIKNHVTVLQVVPSLLKILLDHPDMDRCTTLARVYCGGEPLPASLINRFYDTLEAELYNLYGPTEATIDATCWLCKKEINKERVPIGKPIDNTQLYVLDDDMHPVPIGVAGELWIGGKGLAIGYLGNPKATASRFLPDPFGRHPGGRLYRTGDMVRYRADGNLEYIERVDDQIKLRGFRIELGEIQNVLREHPAVKDVVVRARTDIHGNGRLVAYAVPDHTLLSSNAAEGREDAIHVEQWKMAYDENIYTEPALAGGTSFNIAGWTSSYTQQPIPPREMQDWLDNTILEIQSMDQRRFWRSDAAQD